MGLGARLGRAASIGQGVAVGVGTCNGSQVLFVAQEGMRITFTCRARLIKPQGLSYLESFGHELGSPWLRNRACRSEGAPRPAEGL